MITIKELESYYSANFSNLVKKTYRSCGNYHDAEDIVQVAFERAVKYRETCKSLDGWFHAILRNAYRDYLRVQKVWPITRPIEDCLREIEPAITDQISPAVIAKVLSLVNKEKEPNKTILRMNIKCGYTEGEINMLVTGMTISKIRNVISNFKRKVIKSLQ